MLSQVVGCMLISLTCQAKACPIDGSAICKVPVKVEVKHTYHRTPVRTVAKVRPVRKLLKARPIRKLFRHRCHG